MTNSTIEWTEKTWGPTLGCSECSAGCLKCYAINWAYRLSHMDKMKHDYAGLTKKLPNGKIVWTGLVKTFDNRLHQMLRVRRPAVWFVNSMSDLWHPNVSFSFVDKVFAVMAICEQHVYQLLTKRADRLLRYFKEWYNPEVVEAEARRLLKQNSRLFPDPEKKLAAVRARLQSGPLSNVWLGVSVENQKAARERIPLLQQVPAAVRFLSCEPLLEALPNLDLSGIAWIVCGGESDRNPRPIKEEWVIDLLHQSKAARVLFFFKQWGGRNKKKAGRLLLGREWNEMPPLPPHFNKR